MSCEHTYSCLSCDACPVCEGCHHIDPKVWPLSKKAYHPILMSAPNVRALRAGRKTQTRRILNPQPDHLQHHTWRKKLVYEGEHRMWCWKDLVLENIWDFPDNEDRRALAARCPHGVPGDRLWVRETHAIMSTDAQTASVAYRERMPPGKELSETDGGLDIISLEPEEMAWADDHIDYERWRPSIFMPRWASRITLELTEVRVQLLQEISEDDCIAEGVEITQHRDGFRLFRNYLRPDCPYITAGQSYESLWESINGPGSWDLNPFVFAETFTVIEGALPDAKG